LKILVPYTIYDSDESESEKTIDSNVVVGGIEKFSKDLYENIDGIIPVGITKADRKARLTKSVLQNAINQHEPDIILFNTPFLGNILSSFGIPLILIMHEAIIRDVRMLGLSNIFKKLESVNCHIYFVSKTQHDHFESLVKRISGTSLPKISGYLNPSFCSDNMTFTENKKWDCSTIGRTSSDKDPFFLHRKMPESVSTLVMTNKVKDEKEMSYENKNSHWLSPKNTLYGLKHDSVIEELKRSKVYCSTWPKESWGITAMESLACGVPLLLTLDKRGIHASEELSPSKEFYLRIPKKCSSSDFYDAWKKLASFSNSKRVEMSEILP